MILFQRKPRISTPSEEDENLVATLRIREERLRRLESVKESEFDRRDRELSDREMLVRREEARLRHWAMQVADAAGHLKELFAKSDRFGMRQGATEAQHVAEKALDALCPGKPAPELGDTPKTVIRASVGNAPHDDDPRAGLCIRMPGACDDSPRPHLSQESVLYADMKRLCLLPERGLLDRSGSLLSIAD